MSPRNLCLAAVVILLAACGPEISVVNPLSVLNWSPHDGASGIDIAAEPSVCLSIAVDEESLEFASLRSGDSDPGTIPEARVSADVRLSELDEACIVFSSLALDHDTTYHMVLEPDLRSTDGASLGVTISAKFRTAAEL